MAEMTERNDIDFEDRVEELHMVDPGVDDGLYWARFHRQVMARAVDELARRREMVRLTISEALSGWARLVVPAAAIAAAAAGVLIVQQPSAGADQVIVEDILDVPSTVETEAEAITDFSPTLNATAIAENF